MDTVLKLTAVCSLLLMLVGIGKIIYNQGWARRELIDKINSLEEVIKGFALHVKDGEIHLNVKLEEHLREAQAEWRRGVDNKLNLLLTGGKKEL